jgi:hypothetical protein
LHPSLGLLLGTTIFDEDHRLVRRIGEYRDMAPLALIDESFLGDSMGEYTRRLIVISHSGVLGDNNNIEFGKVSTLSIDTYAEALMPGCSLGNRLATTRYSY